MSFAKHVIVYVIKSFLVYIYIIHLMYQWLLVLFSL